ncbi:ATP-binding protein [Kitasatospora sp. NPDC094011]|uniref:sensor histidine kinase n=1 Tax=Kitasatospora sp. NPDC094011 TaxID=3364090 RepID=UPI00381E03EE
MNSKANIQGQADRGICAPTDSTRRPFRAFPRLPSARTSLHRPLAYVTIITIATATIACAAAAWLVARHEMLAQTDRDLARSWAFAEQELPDRSQAVDTWCRASPGHLEWFDGPPPTVVFEDGTSCPHSHPKSVQTTAEDSPRAADSDTVPAPRRRYRNGRTLDGEPARILTVDYGPAVVDGRGVHAAVLLAKPVKPVDEALDHMASMTCIAAAAIIGLCAALASRAVRRPLAVVEQLARSAEHSALSKEPGQTIPITTSPELGRLAHAFNEMNTALASSHQQQAQLIADAGHELRTPLTTLRADIGLLVRSHDNGRELLPDAQARFLNGLRTQIAELSVLVDGLLLLAGPPRPSSQHSAVALHHLVARVIDRVRHRGQGVKIEARLSPWYIQADERGMERAVAHLLGNAVKFSPAAATVDVELEAGRLTVIDSGPGIPSTDLPFVCDPFRRPPEARRIPASGLGLSIAAHVIHGAGGEIALSRAVPRPDGQLGGTRADIRLPGSVEPQP